VVPSGTVTTGTYVSKVLVPYSSATSTSVSYPGWPGSEKSKVRRSPTRPAGDRRRRAGRPPTTARRACGGAGRTRPSAPRRSPRTPAPTER
jgi:hypothetical protein